MKKIFFIGLICLLCSASAFSQSKKTWEKISNVKSDWENFLKENPEVEYSNAAKDFFAYWISEYEVFLKEYPDGKYSVEAKENLAYLKSHEENIIAYQNELEIKEKEIAAKEEQKKILRQDNFKKLNIGMTPKEVISLLLFDDYINSSEFGGLFVGIGLLPQKGQDECSYSGNAILSGYYFDFKDGKATKWHIIGNEIDSKRFYGEYDNGMTIGTWSISGDSFNTGMKTK